MISPRLPGRSGDLEGARRMFGATPAAVRADCFGSSRGMDLRPAPPALPVRVLAGGNDTVLPPRLGAALSALLPQARFARVPGIGHMVPLEAPERVTLAVVELTAAS